MSNLFTLLEQVSGAILEIRAIIGSGVLWLGLAIGAILSATIRHVFLRREYKPAQITLSLPFGLGNIVYKATDQDRILAWKMYVQLKTRKAALTFDEEFDLIAKVHDSLGNIFPITRDLLSDVCPDRGEPQRNIADFVLRVLNDGIRPHLTQWHAAFRNWWDEAMALPENRNKMPQDLQKEYPQYCELVSDLKRMNEELAKYSKELLEVVHAIPGKTEILKKAFAEKPTGDKGAAGKPASHSTNPVGDDSPHTPNPSAD